MKDNFKNGFLTIDGVLNGLYDFLKQIEPELPEPVVTPNGVSAGGVILNDLVESNFDYSPFFERYYCTKSAQYMFDLCVEALTAHGWAASHR